MERFKTTKKGYDKKEVEDFIRTQDIKNQNTAQAQMMRIDELKARIGELEEEAAELKGKEKNINEALLSAIERAKEMDGTARIRFALEGERIKLFEAKWVNYCRKTMQSQKVKNDMEEFLNSVDKEIRELLEDGLNIGGNASKTDGVTSNNGASGAPEAPQKPPAKRPAKKPPEVLPSNDAEKQFEREKARLKDKMAAGEYVDGFNLSDLNDPPTLADICKQLGLYPD